MAELRKIETAPGLVFDTLIEAPVPVGNQIRTYWLA
jgi:hypothetical protein